MYKEFNRQIIQVLDGTSGHEIIGPNGEVELAEPPTEQERVEAERFRDKLRTVEAGVHFEDRYNLDQ
jgi:hypothetical protein